MEKWKNQTRDYNKMPLMGLEIINNTAETQSLKFFSHLHRHHMARTPLSVRSILGDNVYEDKDLSLLTGFIFDYHSLRIFATVFNTSLLYGAFKGKRFQVTAHQTWNGTHNASFPVSDFVKKDNPTTAEIVECFMVNFTTELEQTNIEAGERLLILFDLGNRNIGGTNEMIEKANMLYGAEKRRKILLTL